MTTNAIKPLGPIPLPEDEERFTYDVVRDTYFNQDGAKSSAYP